MRWISGIASDVNDDLYVVNTDTDSVSALRHGQIAAIAALGYRPFACSLSPDGKLLAVANWGGGSVSLIDPSSLKKLNPVVVGLHPCALMWTRTDAPLYC